jgi:phosphoribosylformimino-5-aminoimidazole carboxamide ribotide isomerase
MRIIPVVDIKKGVVVHAWKGLRKQYKELRSQLCNSSDIMNVVLSLKSAFGFDELYVADLDSIMGKGNNYGMINKLINTFQFRVIVDTGVDSVLKAKELINLGISKVIVGTETLSDLQTLKRILNAIGEEKIIVSLDVKGAKILSKGSEITYYKVEILARIIEEMGINEIIIIDLDRVGNQNGINFHLIKRVIDAVKIPIIVGGGIRNIEDLIMLKKIGVSGALVSTALHNLRIKKDDLSYL